jgi:hypothetical protein
MCDCQHRESLAPSPACTATAQRQTKESEEQRGLSLCSLQEWICDLLIRNQELRMSLLNSATNRPGEADR